MYLEMNVYNHSIRKEILSPFQRWVKWELSGSINLLNIMQIESDNIAIKAKCIRPKPYSTPLPVKKS